MKKSFKYVYGPVTSWRMGVSLGIDPLSDKEKVCNFDCVYCQLGRTPHLTNTRKIYVPTDDLVRELKDFPADKVEHLTFSGRGEPTLALNLGEMIDAARLVRSEKVAVITNSSLLYRPDVRRDLGKADLVVAKLDACSQGSLDAVDKALNGIQFEDILEGISIFRRDFKGRLALQIMFVAENRKLAPGIAAIVRDIRPEQVELNTPLRPCGVPPLGRADMDRLKAHFDGLPVISVYDVEPRVSEVIDEPSTILRHGNYKKGGLHAVDRDLHKDRKTKRPARRFSAPKDHVCHP